MKTIAIYRHKPEVGIGICRHIGFDDNNDFLFSHELFAEDDEEEKGFSVRKVDVERQWVKDDTFDISKIERTTCGRRMNDFGPWQRKENIDYYRSYDGYDRCSFCGSAKFELFKSVIQKVNEGVEGHGIEKATGKSYKFYLKTPENRQIKFYVHHIPNEIYNDHHELHTLEAELTKALKSSLEKVMNRTKSPKN